MYIKLFLKYQTRKGFFEYGNKSRSDRSLKYIFFEYRLYIFYRIYDGLQINSYLLVAFAAY